MNQGSLTNLAQMIIVKTKVQEGTEGLTDISPQEQTCQNLPEWNKGQKIKQHTKPFKYILGMQKKTSTIQVLYIHQKAGQRVKQ